MEIRVASFHLASETQVQITANSAPQVEAGADFEITLPAPAELDGIVTDDGLPDPPGIITSDWSMTSGPGTVTFEDATALLTTARFSQHGDYVLRLTAKDYPQAAPAFDEISIKVNPSPRMLEGLQALYVFDEGSGNVVHDVSGAGAPIDLRMHQIGNNAAALQWLGKGLRIVAPTIIKSNGPALRLINALKTTNEITLEAWIKRAGVPGAKSPDRIVTLSLDGGRRNFTLGQLVENRFQVRLRTTDTDEDGVRLNNGQPAYQDIDFVPELCHVVYTRNASGRVRFYLNGTDPAPTARPTLSGSFGNWENYELALANELTQNYPWLGEFYLVAVYNHAFTQAEVRQNFKAGF